MKISDMSLGQAADALAVITPMIVRIAEDKTIMQSIGTAVNTEGMSVNGLKLTMTQRYSSAVTALFRDHRNDLFGILAAINGKTVEDIAALSVKDAMVMIDEIRHDEDLTNFLASLRSPGKISPSAPSSGSGAAV